MYTCKNKKMHLWVLSLKCDQQLHFLNLQSPLWFDLQWHCKDLWCQIYIVFVTSSGHMSIHATKIHHCVFAVWCDLNHSTDIWFQNRISNFTSRDHMTIHYILECLQMWYEYTCRKLYPWVLLFFIFIFCMIWNH